MIVTRSAVSSPELTPHTEGNVARARVVDDEGAADQFKTAHRSLTVSELFEGRRGGPSLQSTTRSGVARITTILCHGAYGR